MSANLPQIGIVVLSLDRAAALRRALESIVAQAYPRLEIVVMDRGSTDDSINVIRAFAGRLGHWQSKRGDSRSAVINEGVRHCSGDLVAWLDCDDFYLDDSLWTVGQAYRDFPDRGLYIGNGMVRDGGREAPFSQQHLALNRAALVHDSDYSLQPAVFFLRSAWNDVGGLDPGLHYVMNWDIIIRIAERYPAVLINEFLACARSEEPAAGAMERADEIARVTRAHGREAMTPGALKGVSGRVAPQRVNSDRCPEHGDPQDSVYLPYPRRDDFRPPHAPAESALPSISVITPSYNQAQFLRKTLDSILDQQYPKLETIVFDGGSTDGSVELLRQYGGHLTHWASERDRGPAHAINKGFAKASGEILGWVNSDDMLASGSLWEVARAFAEDPELDLVYGNALYIDDRDQLYLADHGDHRTAFYYGEIQPRERIPMYWSYVHAVPQPTVWFRRRLLETCGGLDESCHFIFDFELFWRLVEKAKIRKLNRVQAFYRVHTSSKTTDWNKFLIELYRFSRPLWPRVGSPEFAAVLRDFLGAYMRRRWGNRRRGGVFWAVAGILALSAVTRIGNPEAFRLVRPNLRRLLLPLPAARNPTQPSVVGAVPGPSSGRAVRSRTAKRFHSLFCSHFLPRQPGHSGGEIRDFHLIRHLRSFSTIGYFAVYDAKSDEREDILARLLEYHFGPAEIRAARPDLVDLHALRRPIPGRAANLLRRCRIPVLGPRYHLDVAAQVPSMQAFLRGAVQEALLRDEADFLFVSPQTNPLALLLARGSANTRLVMASYDVERVRMRRIASSQHGIAGLAARLEAGRAARFESDNLARYDAVIAVSDVDRQLFIDDYGLSPERVLTVENSVDAEYFTFAPRRTSSDPHVVFIASFAYLPNRQAAWRLVQEIMPRVRSTYPQACLSLVGQSPPPDMRKLHDGATTVITGTVDDVRPYLAQATVACVPLSSGSGTKYKVLEALSAGVPMVCSPLALEGLELEDGKHVLAAEDDDGLAAAIIRLHQNPDLANSLAREGRQRIEARYTWAANLSRLEGWLASVAALPKRRTEPDTSSTAMPTYRAHTTTGGE